MDKPGFNSGDLWLSTLTPIKWSDIPDKPDGYSHIYAELFDPNSEQTIYQQMLPKDLQIKECIQGWLKDTTNADILRRLRNSQAVLVPPDLENILG